MLPEETILTGASKTGASKKCKECDYEFEFQVMSSPAGYYVGTACPCSGPNSRETGYFKKLTEAQIALESIKADDILSRIRWQR